MCYTHDEIKVTTLYDLDLVQLVLNDSDKVDKVVRYSKNANNSLYLEQEQ